MEQESHLNGPQLAVVLPADMPDSIQGVLNKLKAQTIASQIEIVIATDSAAAFGDLMTGLDDFHSVQLIEVPDLASLGTARALALRATRAPYAFLGETHSFASVPEWAERLVERHREGWAVVVPGFRNANPSKTLSWAGFLLDYGGWLEDQPGAEIDYWPLNNSSCEVAALLETGDDLAHGLSYGDQMLLALKAAGHKVYLDPEAVLSHLNIGRWKPYLDEHFVGGHLVARYRSRDWSVFKRWVYVLASPAIAVLLFARVLQPARRTIRKQRLSMGILPIMLVATVAKAIGELVGYTHFGTDKASELRMTEYELHKAKYT